MTVDQLAAHAEETYKSLGVTLRILPGCTVGAWSTLRLVHMIPITSEHWYAIAMHELGHVMLAHRHDTPRNWKEILAWKWARRAAIVWTPEMEACEIHCLGCWGIPAIDRQNPLKYLLAR